MSNDLEFAIKQDIRNNPVVREVDLDQKREFVRLLGLAAVIVGMLMFALFPRASATAHGYRIQKLRQELAAEQQYQRQYLLELGQVTRPQELRRRAIAELQMIDPPTESILALEKVPAGAPVSHAIVASVR